MGEQTRETRGRGWEGRERERHVYSVSPFTNFSNEEYIR